MARAAYRIVTSVTFVKSEKVAALLEFSAIVGISGPITVSHAIVATLNRPATQRSHALG